MFKRRHTKQRPTSWHQLTPLFVDCTGALGPVIGTEQVANPTVPKNRTPATGFTVQCVSKTGHELLSIQQLPVQEATVRLRSALCLPVILPPVHLCPLCVYLSLYHQYSCALFVFARHSTASTSVPSLCLPVILPPVHPCPLCVCPSLYSQYSRALFVFAHHSTTNTNTSVPSLFAHHSTASTSTPSLCLPITLPPVHPCPLCISNHSTASTSVLYLP